MKRIILGDLTKHIMVNSLLALFIYWRFASFELVLLGFFSGFILDVDHLFDYFLHYGFRWDFLAFIRGDYIRESGKYYNFFHSWEIIIILALTWIISNFNDAILVVMLGFLCHMVVDQQRTKFGYFLLFRFLKKFEVSAVINPQLQKKLWKK